MNQKKHLNAIAALEASKDAEPGSLWSGDYCENVNCGKCYAHPPEVLAGCCGVRTVSKVRAALQSGLDAYHKRKAEKADRQATGCAHHFINDVCELCRKTRDEIAEDKKPSPPAPLIPDPPDTPEVRALMEGLAKGGPCLNTFTAFRCGGSPRCPIRGTACGEDGNIDYDARHDFAISWLARHPAVCNHKFTMLMTDPPQEGPCIRCGKKKSDLQPPAPAKWDAEKGPTLVKGDGIKDCIHLFHTKQTGYSPATITELMPYIFDADRQFHDEAIRRGYVRAADSNAKAEGGEG